MSFIAEKFLLILDIVDANPRNRAISLEGILDKALLFICETNFGTRELDSEQRYVMRKPVSLPLVHFFQ